MNFSPTNANWLPRAGIPGPLSIETDSGLIIWNIFFLLQESNPDIGIFLDHRGGLPNSVFNSLAEQMNIQLIKIQFFFLVKHPGSGCTVLNDAIQI